MNIDKYFQSISIFIIMLPTLKILDSFNTNLVNHQALGVYIEDQSQDMEDALKLQLLVEESEIFFQILGKYGKKHDLSLYCLRNLFHHMVWFPLKHKLCIFIDVHDLPPPP